jgi:hypothetical protein
MEAVVTPVFVTTDDLPVRVKRNSLARRHLLEDLAVGRRNQHFLFEVANVIESEARGKGCWAIYGDLIREIRLFAPLIDSDKAEGVTLQQRAANALNQLWGAA